MHYEVEVIVPLPLDDHAHRFLSEVQRSANHVLRFHGDDRAITVTVEAHALDPEGAVRAARGEMARIYPSVPYAVSGEPQLR
jgi:hypothetical protein